MSDLQRLKRHLSLKSIEAGSLTFAEFLGKLKESPEIADTAPALIVRAIKSRGVVDIEKEPVERQGYLRLLQSMRIPAWKAFDHVRGSQATVSRILGHLEAAAANGMQLRQALVLIGGPACGKSFLADALKATLEGELVYAVDGCPIHENPINLLKLLTEEQLAELAKELEMDDPEGVTLQSLVHVAGAPCRHCYNKLMFNDGKAVEEPDLGSMNIKMLRLSSRTFGVSTWGQADGGCSLVEAIKTGSAGIVDIPELCAVQTALPGTTLQIDALIEATDARRIPDLTSCGDNAGFLPVNAFIIGQTNQGSWDAFMKGQPDPDKWTRRMSIRSVPYITARIEEELAYRTFLEGMKDAPTFDPVALKLAATLAVLTRIKMVDGLSPLDKVRLMNGETFVVKKYAGKSSSGGYGGMSTASTAPLTPKEIEELMKKAGEVKDERQREGMFGLTMSFMLSFISELAERAMHAPRHPGFPNTEPTVTAIGMIDALRNKLTQYAQTNGLTEAQKTMVKTCLDEFLLQAKETTDIPGWLEREYRRLLREQILEVFSPDFERRAQETFLKYQLHARAYGNRLSKVKLPGVGLTKEVEVDVDFLDKIDKGRGLKSNLSDVRDYRGSIDAQLNDLAYSHGTLPSEQANELKVDWTTLPELKQAIEEFLNADIAKKVEKVVTTKYDLLDDDDKAFYDAAFASFTKLGYNEVSLARALEYAKELKLWAQPQF
jgi:predicted Ser/Thr protein kinase